MGSNNKFAKTAGHYANRQRKVHPPKFDWNLWVGCTQSDSGTCGAGWIRTAEACVNILVFGRKSLSLVLLALPGDRFLPALFGARSARMMWQPFNVIDHGTWLLPSQACVPGFYATTFRDGLPCVQQPGSFSPLRPHAQVVVLQRLHQGTKYLSPGRWVLLCVLCVLILQSLRVFFCFFCWFFDWNFLDLETFLLF